MARALDDLSERERVIVRARLMTEEPRTLQDLGDELGVSKERVRQIEVRVVEKLRTVLDEAPRPGRLSARTADTSGARRERSGAGSIESAPLVQWSPAWASRPRLLDLGHGTPRTLY